ncbi:MAG: hypothetical protein QM608_10505 [Caulobacter sp.]
MRSRNPARHVLYAGVVLVVATGILAQKLTGDGRITAAAMAVALVVAAVGCLRAARCPRCGSLVTAQENAYWPRTCPTCNRDLRRNAGRDGDSA